MKKLWLCLTLALAAAAARAQQQEGEGRVHLAVQERRIVQLSEGSTLADGRRVLADLRLNVVRELPLIRGLVVELPLGRLEELEARLMADPRILRVEEDLYQNWLLEGGLPAMPSVADVLGAVRSRLAEEPPAGEPPQQEEGELPWGIKRVRAENAWPVTSGAGAVVAVIDTGIDASHPDLASNYKGGFNAVSTTTAPNDDHGHGTHVSGTVAAALDQKGVAGVAPGAGLVAVKVLDANGSGYISDIIAGIDWVVSNRYPVINMSLGGPRGTSAFHDAIKAAVKAGVTVVCAAGNSGPPRSGSNSSVGYPAAYPEAIAVSASDSADKLAYFSSRGPEVDFVGPGVQVQSTLPGGAYGKYSGTSMASPHLAGLAALAVAKGASGPEAVRNALKAAAVPLADLKPDEQGAGMPDAGKLVGASIR